MFKVQNESVKINDFRDLLNSLLPKASHWVLIGIQLGLEMDVLNIIKANSSGGVEECLTKALQKWFNRTPNATWNEVIAALRTPALDEIRLAKELEQKFSFGNDVTLTTSLNPSH